MKKQLSLPACLSSVHDYLTAEAVVRETDEHGKPGASRPLDQLNEHTFYQWDAGSALGVSHALHDLALEEATGEVFTFGRSRRSARGWSTARRRSSPLPTRSISGNNVWIATWGTYLF